MNVLDRKLDLVSVSTVSGGETFRWNGRYYIRPSDSVVTKHNIAGINLEGGEYLSGTTMLVELVKMEARVL